FAGAQGVDVELDVFAGGAVEAAHVDDLVGVFGDEHGVGDGAERRRVDEHEVVVLFHARDELSENGVFEQFGGALGAAAGAEQVDVFADGGDAEVGVVEELVVEGGAGFEPAQEAGVVFVAEVAVQHGAAQVAVDDEGAAAVAGEAAGEVAGDEGLAFAGDGAGDEDGLGEVELGVDLHRAVNAEEGFDAVILALVEDELVFLLVLGVVEFGDDAEQVGADEVFDVPGALDAVVDEGEAEGDGEEDGDAEADGGAGDGLDVGGVGFARNFGGIEGADGDFLEVAAGGGLGEAVE